MNIFHIGQNDCPFLSAKNLCDNHHIKMSVESCQMISTVLIHYYGYVQSDTCLMKETHVYHPCNNWLIESVGNLEWLYYHLAEMLSLKRFNVPDRYHAILSQLEMFLSSTEIEPSTEPPLCMPDEYKVYLPDYVECYRQYYMSKALTFSRPMRYTKGKLPDWFTKHTNHVTISKPQLTRGKRLPKLKM